MNNNNLYNTNNFIGITHNDYFKTASNALSKAINSLELNSSNYTSNVSNILDTKITNVSNILNNNSSNYIQNTSNYIISRYDPMIETKSENVLLPIPGTLKHTYINNSNTLGEIRFWCKDTQLFPVIIPVGVPDYRVKIDVDGKLKIYYTYDPAINATFFNGWIDVGTSIAGLNASDANIGIAITGLELQLQFEVRKINIELEQLLIYQQRTLGNDAFIEMTDEIAVQMAENQMNSLSFNTMRNNLNQFFATGATSYLSSALGVVALRLTQNPAVSLFLGIGGIAFAAFVGASQNQAYIQTINSLIEYKIKDAYDSNIINSTRRDELLSSNNELIVDNYISYCSNIYNATLAQGFINSNITGQQYISSLKCDTLNLNTGNIANINGVAANEIIAAGKIKQNNILLDDTYLTSNHLYNLAYNYTAERQYPSKLYNTILQQDTITLLGLLKYRTSFYLNNQSIAYGSGVYEIYYSSQYDTNTRAENLFNYDTSQTTTSARFGITLYSSGTGDYLGNDKINNYYGDWVIIKMPQEIMLTRYRIYQRTDAPTKAPSLWKVFGSKDGITFTEITQASQTTRLTSYTNNYYEKTLSSFTTLYQYYGFVFGSLLSVSGQTDLSFAELQIFGKEIISNTITSQIYTTSNIAKNLIIYQTPEVCKHFAFYCQTSSVIYINGGNTPYYKYDIDMTNYTTTGYIQIGSGSNDPYRIFRIRAFLGSCYFSKLTNGLPDILNYEIYMSSKAAAGGSGTTAGINIFAIGYPNNSSLNIIPPNNLFILSNPANTFNYITLVSTSPADCRVIIEDLIS